jgi:hypothetical protein
MQWLQQIIRVDVLLDALRTDRLHTVHIFFCPSTYSYQHNTHANDNAKT